MANIRTRLIHMLGGVTKEEWDQFVLAEKLSSFTEGKHYALVDTLALMEREYGNPEWGTIVYNHVKNSREELLKQTS